MFNIPNLLTSCNFLCGIFSIILAFSGLLDIAAYLLLLAMLFDFFDGFVARKFHLQSELGKQLDSLADMVSFGVAPGILMFLTIEISLLGYEQQFNFSRIFQKYHDFNFHSANDFLPLSALSIPFFSLFRLAKFNIDTRQSDKFIGIPTPLNTLFFIFFPLVLSSYNHEANSILNFNKAQPVFIHASFMSLTALLFPILLISEIPLIALKFKDFSWGHNKLRYALLGISLIIIILLGIYSLPIIVILYLLLSLIENYSNRKE